MYYTRNIESEAPQIIEENRPPDNWPSKGEIEYKDVSAQFDRQIVFDGQIFQG